MLARTFGFFNHKHAVGWRADAQRWLDVLTGIGSCLCTILPTSSSLPSWTLYSQRQALVQVPWFGSRLLI
jgi:hypothetical protein